MICGIGIDSVEIKRFAHWSTYTHKKLLRLFSEQEITYCLSNPAKSAERFAARFAAREAFFKAYCSMNKTSLLPFLAVCKNVTITHANNGAPNLTVQWKNLLNEQQKEPAIHLSLTHTTTTATAYIILETSH